MNNGCYQLYQQTNIMTADEKKLIIMCYEEAIYSLKSAKTHFLNQDYVTKGKAVQKALDILNELRGALNFERGGIIAKNLDLIYGFLIRYILDADIKKDMKAFDQAASILSELKSAWEQIFYGNVQSKSLYSTEAHSLIS